MKKILLSCILAAASVIVFAAPRISETDKQKARDLVSKMTLEEKCLLVAGQIDGFHTAEIARLGIPSVRMADGPQGVRNKTNSTYYPCGLAIAASWNREVAKGVGSGIGVDAKARGVGIMLCPGVNIYRSPLCGRNFEYMGEDPYLASETAANYICGIQEEGTMATIKHFAANNQEYQRHQVNSIVDERTLNEIYFPTFRKAVEKANVAAVMTSYNPLNGVHAAENPTLIKDNLRKWGFQGIVMSDWTSTYTTLGCLTSGLDLEMPRGYVLNYEMVKPLIENGMVSISELDEKCIHILQSFSAYGFLDNPMKDTNSIPVNEDSRAKAYAAAVESPVLLKNEGVLPLKGGNIVVMGPNADYIAFGGGSGSMYPIPGTTTTLYEGLKQLGKKYKVTYVNGPTDEALIRKADAVIYAAGFDKRTETEGSDRTYKLPFNQNDQIVRAAELNKKVIVIVYAGGEIDTSKWLDKVAGLMMGWYSGQEGGKALAAILSGAASPSGRLPFTFWGSMKKNPSTPYYAVPAKPSWSKDNRDGNAFNNTIYSEGVFLGYRAVGREGIEKPLYPFGYGLTYSKFDYSDIKAVRTGNGFDVTFTVANTGSADASEVAQLYIAPVNSKVSRPAKELKGYEKVKLAKGAKSTVTIHISPEDFGYYSVDTHSWKYDAGNYRILVGASSEDIRLEAAVTLQ